jgi:hypothetical protein
MFVRWRWYLEEVGLINRVPPPPIEEEEEEDSPEPGVTVYPEEDSVVGGVVGCAVANAGANSPMNNFFLTAYNASAAGSFSFHQVATFGMMPQTRTFWVEVGMYVFVIGTNVGLAIRWAQEGGVGGEFGALAAFRLIDLYFTNQTTQNVTLVACYHT